MKDIHYAYCVARLRANEKHMIPMEQMLRFCEMKSSDEVITELKNLGWIKQEGSVSDYVKQQSTAVWRLLSESVPDKGALDVLCILNDFFNIKAAVKCLFTSQSPENYYVYPTTLDLEALTKKIAARDFKALGGIKGECAKSAFESATATENGQYAEIITDRAAIDCLSDYSKKNGNSLIGEICAFLCDTSNIKIAMRINSIKRNRDFAATAIGECVRLSKDALIELSCSDEEDLLSYLNRTPYAQGVEIYKKGSACYDKWCDDTIIKIASKAKYTAFGFDPVCAYYYAKQNEIKSVRIILSALESHQSADTIKERVRALYV